jgi:hypothetical protein
MSGKVSFEIRLADADLLDRGDLVALDASDLVHHQKMDGDAAAPSSIDQCSSVAPSRTICSSVEAGLSPDEPSAERCPEEGGGANVCAATSGLRI